MLKIDINIGGTIFSTYQSTLIKATILYHEVTIERKRFFDKDPTIFSFILNHLRGYNIVYPENKNQLIMLHDDAHFYGINDFQNDIRYEIIKRYPTMYEFYTVNELHNALQNQTFLAYQKKDSLNKSELIELLTKNSKIACFNTLNSIVQFIAKCFGYEKIFKDGRHNKLVQCVAERFLLDKLSIINDHPKIVQLANRLMADIYHNNEVEVVKTNSSDEVSDIDDLYDDIVKELNIERCDDSPELENPISNAYVDDIFKNIKPSHSEVEYQNSKDDLPEELPQVLETEQVNINDIMMNMISGMNIPGASGNNQLMDSLKEVTHVLTQNLTDVPVNPEHMNTLNEMLDQLGKKCNKN